MSKKAMALAGFSATFSRKESQKRGIVGDAGFRRLRHRPSRSARRRRPRGRNWYRHNPRASASGDGRACREWRAGQVRSGTIAVMGREASSSFSIMPAAKSVKSWRLMSARCLVWSKACRQREKASASAAWSTSAARPVPLNRSSMFFSKLHRMVRKRRASWLRSSTFADFGLEGCQHDIGILVHSGPRSTCK